MVEKIFPETKFRFMVDLREKPVRDPKDVPLWKMSMGELLYRALIGGESQSSSI